MLKLSSEVGGGGGGRRRHLRQQIDIESLNRHQSKSTNPTASTNPKVFTNPTIFHQCHKFQDSCWIRRDLTKLISWLFLNKNECVRLAFTFAVTFVKLQKNETHVLNFFFSQRNKSLKTYLTFMTQSPSSHTKQKSFLPLSLSPQLHAHPNQPTSAGASALGLCYGRASICTCRGCAEPIVLLVANVSHVEPVEAQLTGHSVRSYMAVTLMTMEVTSNFVRVGCFLFRSLEF